MKFNFFHKVLLIFALLMGTFLYGQYERKKYYNSSSSSNDFVLKELPDFQVFNIKDNSAISSKEFITNTRGVFVHIWGTWCAPCEKEMPDFLEYAQKLNSENIKFLLVAVNDEEMKIKKFLSRFKAIPTNVTFAIDKNNQVMDLLGTLKVPETFLFNNEGKHINKFIGPQDWLQESYVTRLNFWLNNQKNTEEKIESH